MVDRTPSYELGLSTTANNLLKLAGVRYVDEVQAVIDKIKPSTHLARELTEKLRLWRCKALDIAKLEVAIKALEDLERDERDELTVMEQRAAAEIADAMRVAVARLRDLAAVDSWQKRAWLMESGERGSPARFEEWLKWGRRPEPD